jgi:hypothetical protein
MLTYDWFTLGPTSLYIGLVPSVAARIAPESDHIQSTLVDAMTGPLLDELPAGYVQTSENRARRIVDEQRGSGIGGEAARTEYCIESR